MGKVTLFVVDGQNDFCDPSGSLYVPGADKDMERLSVMIKRLKRDIDDCVATCDMHRTLHIAHPIWWVNDAGNHPDPFTLIRLDDVEGPNPKWKAMNPGYQKRSVEYVKSLEDNKRYLLCIWPPHCRIGSTGAAIYPALFDAFWDWESQCAAVNYVTKVSNMLIDRYSVYMEDVFDTEDPTTGLNTSLIKTLQESDVIAIAGEASSHCVANSVRDLAINFGEDNVKKFVYLEDTSSPVPTFENLEKDFLDEMTGRGMKVTTSDKFLK